MIEYLLAINLQIQAPVCGPMREIVRALMGKDYKEEPVWVGTTIEDGTSSVLFVNRETKTWTILVSKGGTACVVGMGEGFKEIGKETILY